MKQQVKTVLPTKYGDFEIIVFSDDPEDIKPHFAIVSKGLNPLNVTPVRIHSECLTGDLLGSSRCDCGEQLEESLKIIHEQSGVIIYLRQEGRGIGLINKLKAYNLQDKGLNTIDANIELGFHPDERNYELAIEILNQIGISRIKLITNNPEKLKEIEGSGIQLEGRIPIIISPNKTNEGYLQVKKELMGHLL